ncbi:hypothetical protein [Actinoplanes sp. ATCC 53533]|uniref:hypothetical protein n=1 Tax=Actinoplanes sp. ATCC 53533 TaxID=1288362 RepID=UPI000F78D81C|nr:hypothetical protein [Actinoplanes sp. ATCC 53533]
MTLVPRTVRPVDRARRQTTSGVSSPGGRPGADQAVADEQHVERGRLAGRPGGAAVRAARDQAGGRHDAHQHKRE